MLTQDVRKTTIMVIDHLKATGKSKARDWGILWVKQKFKNATVNSG